MDGELTRDFGEQDGSTHRLLWIFFFFFFSVSISVLGKYYYRVNFHKFPFIHGLCAGCGSQPVGTGF